MISTGEIVENCCNNCSCDAAERGGHHDNGNRSVYNLKVYSKLNMEGVSRTWGRGSATGGSRKWHQFSVYLVLCIFIGGFTSVSGKYTNFYNNSKLYLKSVT